VLALADPRRTSHSGVAHARNDEWRMGFARFTSWQRGWLEGMNTSMGRIGMKLRGLRQARQRRGISISQLAEATGLRREMISRLEHGQEDPQPYVVHRLEAALGAGVAELSASPGAVGVASTDQIAAPIAFDTLTRRLVPTR
jgi:DNA-binding XRE family transcriptional regulator